MAFALEEKEDVGEGIRRIVSERVDQALEALREKGGTALGEIVHSARKRFKEVRAVLRLVRKDLGKEVFEKENRAFRDAGRPLSDVRDAYVLVEAVDGLAKTAGSGVTAATLRPLRQSLIARRRDIRRKVVDEEQAMERVVAAMEAARKRIKDWPLKHCGWATIEAGLRTTYQAGRKAMGQALRDGSDEEFHEWRKRVKDLRYQLEILEPLWPSVMRQLASEVHTLADLLGEDHDLVVLQQILLERPHVVKRTDAAIQTIQDRQKDLRRRAKRCGSRVYSERPKAFVRRIEKYWEIFRGS